MVRAQGTKNKNLKLLASKWPKAPHPEVTWLLVSLALVSWQLRLHLSEH